MDFEFDKFVTDLEKRQQQNGQKNTKRIDEAEMDRLRRLRAEQYHERWQNRIVWEDKR
jgi:hypothetical protein